MERGSLHFLGGVGTVTGSKILFEWDGLKVLIDCGLFQGLKQLRLLNRAPFPVNPSEIDRVLLTHAHLDHSGYLPLLVKNGFRGKIHCTPPTKDLAELLLLDSAKIQEEDADYANAQGYSRHSPALPLYNTGDVEQALGQFESVNSSDAWHSISPDRPDVQFRFSKSGHILGSAFIELKYPGGKIVFSGDLGRAHPLLLHSPSRLPDADFLVVESTYGDRRHPVAPPEKELARVVLDTVARGGHLIIPSFAVGRAQELIHLLSNLIHQGIIPRLPIFLDSPLGIDATQVFLRYSGWHSLNRKQIEEFSQAFTRVKSPEHSRRLLADRGTTSIVIAGSGMITGGRVLYHLEQHLSDERSTILLVGYQAAGTRGRLLQDGCHELKFHGRYLPVRAKVEAIACLSAHADQEETLEWLSGAKSPPRKTFIVHGELQASEALLIKVRDKLGWPAVVPKPLEKFAL